MTNSCPSFKATTSSRTDSRKRSDPMEGTSPRWSRRYRRYLLRTCLLNLIKSRQNSLDKIINIKEDTISSNYRWKIGILRSWLGKLSGLAPWRPAWSCRSKLGDWDRLDG
jgi:hypothetical protein